MSSTRPHLIGMADWPLSKMDQLRQTTRQGATVPLLNHTVTVTSPSQPIDCPACRSILAGAADGKRILLLGHELVFAGAEIWLLNMGQLLEQAGATVRFLFLCQSGPLLSQHDEMSYLFANEDTGVVFQDFDLVIANTVVIETVFHFFEKASRYLPRQDMDALYEKTIFWVHELDPEQWSAPALSRVLRSVGKVLFDSHAGKNKWANAIDNLLPKSDVIMPGVSLERIKQIDQAIHHDTTTTTTTTTTRNARRRLLNLPTTSDDDVVIIQVSTIFRAKGSYDLIEAFDQMINSLPKQVAQERGWCLILLGNLLDRNVVDVVKVANDRFAENNFRSRILIKEPTIDVASYYAVADIAVLNSICENFGMVVAEAMFARLPNIARACGGIPEIISHGETGFLLSNTRNPVAELASVLLTMTSGDGWREKLYEMGNKAAIVAREKFTCARFARELSNVITDHLYFSGSNPMWSCSSSIKGLDARSKVVVERSRGDQTLAAVPALPALGKYDIGCAAVGSGSLYIFGGYMDIDHVSKGAEYYSLEDNVWRTISPLPDDAAESHQAITADDRYIYYLSGQLGAQCNRPIERSFVYDTKEEEWKEIPSLPVARYAACAALLNGRLHFVGGLDIDRRTPMQDHYSMSLEDLHSFLEQGTSAPTWKEEPAIPYGSGHVLCKVLSSSKSKPQQKLYYFGGETEDYFAKDPVHGDFSCNQGLEYNNPFVFVYNGTNWERGSDMPFAVSHAEGSSFISNITSTDTLFFGGSGLHEKEIAGETPVLSDGIYQFSAQNEEFQRIGSLYPIGLARKGTCGISRLAVDEEGNQRLQVFVVGGQASQSRSVPWAGPIDNFAMLCESTSAMSDLGL